MTMDNTALAAHERVETFGDQLRRWAVTDAVRWLDLGEPDEALRRLTGSVLGEQARAAGIRVVER